MLRYRRSLRRHQATSESAEFDGAGHKRERHRMCGDVEIELLIPGDDIGRFHGTAHVERHGAARLVAVGDIVSPWNHDETGKRAVRVPEHRVAAVAWIAEL